MLKTILNFIKRPLADEQTTARLAFQRYNGPVLEGVNGGAGFTVKGQVRATYPAGIAPGPTHRLTDLSSTGNDNSTIHLQPLSDNRNL